VGEARHCEPVVRNEATKSRAVTVVQNSECSVSGRSNEVRQCRWPRTDIGLRRFLATWFLGQFGVWGKFIMMVSQAFFLLMPPLVSTYIEAL
jgi:hypothetical protein